MLREVERRGVNVITKRRGLQADTDPSTSKKSIAKMLKVAIARIRNLIPLVVPVILTYACVRNKDSMCNKIIHV